MLQNKQVYDSAAVARGYASQTYLQPPEETILRSLIPELRCARMLDLGVGGGRTTLYFAPWVREYVATDYSARMIAECERRFFGYPPHISFRVCDARDLREFESGSFDFVLFSFNGIDCVGHEDRLKIFAEVARVGKPGGRFCFSSHNLNYARNTFELGRAISFNPRHAMRSAKRVGLRFIYNWRIRAATVRTADHLIFNDGAHYRSMQMYYVRPADQVTRLRVDFDDVQVFSLDSGAPVELGTELAEIGDAWLYYLCRFR